MENNEKCLQFLEEHIPDLAAVAFKQAYWQALAEGSSVLEVENGAIVEVFPDGFPHECHSAPKDVRWPERIREKHSQVGNQFKSAWCVYQPG